MRAELQVLQYCHLRKYEAALGHQRDAASHHDMAGRPGQGLAGEQAGGDEERLGDRGVLDGLGIGLGAVVDKVEPDDIAEFTQAGRELRILQPWGEEAGGLGALSGRDDR